MKLLLITIGVLMCLHPGLALAQSRSWEEIPVPGAKCADGSQYGVYISRRSTKKLVIYFQGGGACWDFITCRALPGFTPQHMPKGPEKPDSGILAGDSARSPVSDFSVLYFPYCTGDAFAGAHVARYAFGTKIHHWGSVNVRLAMKYIYESETFDATTAEHVVVYGFSAGAIGAAFSVHEIDRYLTSVRRKTAILDSPGLHFGHIFWQKFPRALLTDFGRALAGLGIELHVKDGNLARHAPEVSRRFSDWEIGVLQSSRDLIMSVIFSTMTPLAHERLVYAPNGLWESVLNSNDNTSAWVPPITKHTFLTDDKSGQLKAGGTSALTFVTDIIEGYGGISYR